MDITKVITHGIRAPQGKTITKAKVSEKFSLEADDNTNQVSNNSQVQFAPLDALFLNLNQERKKQQKFVEHGNDLLNQLDSLRLGIISGRMPRHILENISNTLSNRKDLPTEEPLKTILLEIETRAKVELAKLEKAI